MKSSFKKFGQFWIPNFLLLIVLSIITIIDSSYGMDNFLRRRSQFDKIKKNQLRNSDLSTINRSITGIGKPSISLSSSSSSTSSSSSGSVNQILSLDSTLNSRWDSSTQICSRTPGLTREQMELCLRNPDTTEVAINGIQLGINECGHQMAKHRWNCSSLQGSLNPHSLTLLQKGYRESAFGHAIAAAGVTFAVAKACSQGKLLSCGCGFQYDDQVNLFGGSNDLTSYKSKEDILKLGQGSSWKWSGCSHNMNYGMKFAKKFLDSREKSTDLPSRINLHNNRVGRMAVSNNMEIKCKCHGLSGSCELRTCWRSSPEFRRVGTELKNKFRRAIMIDQTEFGNRGFLRGGRKGQHRRKRRGSSSDKQRDETKLDLWYYERSPTYCESNPYFGFHGTMGRRCNRTEDRRDAGSCSTLCCGRGYSTIRQVTTTRCKCTFRWCCEVTCQNCTQEEWVTVCK